MMVGLLLMASVAAILLTLWGFRLRPGFRGGIGCRSEHSLEIVSVRVDGFSRPVQCQPLKQGEHSFSYLGRQDVPDEVSIAWRLAADTEEHRATISLRDIPRNAPGEAGLLFVLGADEVWRPKYAPDLLASLMKTSR